MDSMRKTALVAGILYLLTFISSIPAVFLQSPVLNDPNFIISSVDLNTQVRLGALFDIVNSLTAIGTAVALYAVIKRQSQGFAIGFVSSRLFEGTVLMIGVISILSIVTLQQPGATGAEASLLVTVQETLVTVRNWTFVLGTGVPALNAVLLGWIMYKSRLVPRAIPVIGLIGAPLFTSWIIGYVLGVTEPGTAWHGIGVAPIFIWELSLGLWMTFKGFRKDAPLMIEAAAEDARPGRLDERRPRRPSVWRPRQAPHDGGPRAGAADPAAIRGPDGSGCCIARPTGSPGEASASPGRWPAASSGCSASPPSGDVPASRESRSSATTRMARTSSPWP